MSSYKLGLKQITSSGWEAPPTFEDVRQQMEEFDKRRKLDVALDTRREGSLRVKAPGEDRDTINDIKAQYKRYLKGVSDFWLDSYALSEELQQSYSNNRTHNLTGIILSAFRESEEIGRDILEGTERFYRFTQIAETVEQIDYRRNSVKKLYSLLRNSGCEAATFVNEVLSELIGKPFKREFREHLGKWKKDNLSFMNYMKRDIIDLKIMLDRIC